MWQPIVRLSTSLGRDNRCSARLLGAVAVISCIMVIFNSNAPAPAAVERTTRQAAASPCLRLFGMSESRRFWEPPSQPSPAACLGSGVPPQHAGPCLTELRRRRGRPAHVAFIGDSRARVLFLTLCETLGLTRKQDDSHWYSQVEHHEQYLERGRRLQCPYYTPMSKHGHTGKYWSERPCFMEAFSDPVRVVAHWTPFLVTGYLERLQAMEEDCGSGLACPDVVIMTLGMWYAVATSAHPHLNTPDRLLLFRDDVNTLVPVLQRLARRTQLVYRMDGAHFTEIAFPGNKSNTNAGLLTTNDIAMETFRRKVPGLQVWTSSLAETVRFQHTVCRYLLAVGGPLKVRNRHECLDYLHVGETVRLSAAAAIIRYLCRDTERHPSGHCCVADTGHRRW